MAYTPTQWTTGDTITATAMNKIENGIAGAGGYDAEIIIYHDNNSAHNYEFTIVSGSYASLRSLIENHIAPNVLVRILDDLNVCAGSTTNVYFYGVGGNGFNLVINIYAKRWNSSSYLKTDWWSMEYLHWTPQDELIMD